MNTGTNTFCLFNMEKITHIKNIQEYIYLFVINKQELFAKQLLPLSIEYNSMHFQGVEILKKVPKKNILFVRNAFQDVNFRKCSI